MSERENDPNLSEFVAFIRTFLLPTLIVKVFLLYFGLNYSRYPGEGYGYGLVGAMLFTLAGFAYFLWRQKRPR